jgi:hypothetical protein
MKIIDYRIVERTKFSGEVEYAIEEYRQHRLFKKWDGWYKALVLYDKELTFPNKEFAQIAWKVYMDDIKPTQTRVIDIKDEKENN